MISRKRQWIRHCQALWRQVCTPNCLLVMPKESSMMTKAPTRIESRWAGRGVRLKCVEEMVVIGLICVFIGFVSFVSKPSLSLIIKWYVQTADYQIKDAWLKPVSLIIKGPDNQAQNLKYQINQYLSEILIVRLWSLYYPRQLRWLLGFGWGYGIFSTSYGTFSTLCQLQQAWRLRGNIGNLIWQ